MLKPCAYTLNPAHKRTTLSAHKRTTQPLTRLNAGLFLEQFALQTLVLLAQLGLARLGVAPVLLRLCKASLAAQRVLSGLNPKPLNPRD